MLVLLVLLVLLLLALVVVSVLVLGRCITAWISLRGPSQVGHASLLLLIHSTPCLADSALLHHISFYN